MAPGMEDSYQRSIIAKLHMDLLLTMPKEESHPRDHRKSYPVSSPCQIIGLFFFNAILSQTMRLYESSVA